MLALGVGPIAVLSAAFWVAHIGVVAALSHGLVTLMAALILVEIETWGVPSIPCTRPFDPGTVNIQARWPAYVLGLILFCGELPQAEVALLAVPFGIPILLLPMAALFLLLRRLSVAAAALAAASEDRDSLLLLDLSMPPPLRDPRP
jgi:hypothetical protein